MVVQAADHRSFLPDKAPGQLPIYMPCIPFYGKFLIWCDSEYKYQKRGWHSSRRREKEMETLAMARAGLTYESLDIAKTLVESLFLSEKEAFFLLLSANPELIDITLGRHGLLNYVLSFREYRVAIRLLKFPGIERQLNIPDTEGRLPVFHFMEHKELLLEFLEACPLEELEIWSIKFPSVTAIMIKLYSQKRYISRKCNLRILEMIKRLLILEHNLQPAEGAVPGPEFTPGRFQPLDFERKGWRLALHQSVLNKNFTRRSNVPTDNLPYLILALNTQCFDMFRLVYDYLPYRERLDEGLIVELFRSALTIRQFKIAEFLFVNADAASIIKASGLNRFLPILELFNCKEPAAYLANRLKIQGREDLEVYYPALPEAYDVYALLILFGDDCFQIREGQEGTLVGRFFLKTKNLPLEIKSLLAAFYCKRRTILLGTKLDRNLIWALKE